MGYNASPALVPGGNIYPSRFLKLSASADHTALQSTANAEVIGVSGREVIDTREDVGNAYHATTTKGQLRVLSIGDADIYLQAGTGGWTRGDLLESDSDGKGVTSNGPGRNIGAIALESASADGFGRVQVIKLKSGGQGAFEAIATDGAITIKEGTAFITKGSLAAVTIAAPTATTDDNKRLTVISTTPFAHTLTLATAGFNSSGTVADVVTFSVARGSAIDLVAYQGVWYTIGHALNANAAAQWA